MGVLRSPGTPVKCANCGKSFAEHSPSKFEQIPEPICPTGTRWKAAAIPVPAERKELDK